jgi:phosphoglycolate phosphatase
LALLVFIAYFVVKQAPLWRCAPKPGELLSMPYQAVLFDLDGTLLNTLDDLADSMNAVLARHGLPQHGLAAYKYYVGDGMANLVRRALSGSVCQPAGQANGLSHELMEQCLAELRAEYSQRWHRKTRPYDGIPELLDALEARRIKLAVLSNKPDDMTQLTVRELLPRWRFAEVRGERPGFLRKPDPAAALEIAAQLGVPPRGFLYLGDTSTDMQTALAAGMFPLGALWGFRLAEELAASGAKALLARPLELVSFL